MARFCLGSSMGNVDFLLHDKMKIKKEKYKILNTCFCFIWTDYFKEIQKYKNDVGYAG